MLSPNDDRLDYGNVIAPPENYRLDFAIGTTYSLDLDALVGVCLALGLSEATDSNLMKNPICLLEALRTTEDKVALFCEAGQIHVPNRVTPLYILLEKMVVQVNTDKKKGIAKYPSFHPKFWLLRYVNERNLPVYRVVVLSRNLTFDRSWDITFCMDGTVNRRKTLKTAPVIDFISYLMEALSADGNGGLKRKRIREMIRELPYVHFELDSKEFEDFEFLPVGIRKHSGGFYSTEDWAFAPLFQDTFHELLVISPFLTGSVIKDFNDRNTYISKTEYMLITRLISLEKLKPGDCSNFRIFTMKDAVIDGESAISDEALQIQKQDIHAKVYMVRKYSDSYLYLGSMNASHNAIYGNIEFMMMLKSKNRYLNLSKLSEALFGGNEAASDNPFQEVTLSNGIAADEEQELQSVLEHDIKAISRMKPKAAVFEKEGYYDLIITFSQYMQRKASGTRLGTERAMKVRRSMSEYPDTCCLTEARFPGNYKVKISPLLSNKTEDFAETIQFHSLQLTQLSEFYKVVITDGLRTVQRVIMIPTDGLPENREKAVVNSVIKDQDCFCRYVFFLLGDSHILGAVETNAAAVGSGLRKNQNSISAPALYEKMLQASVSEPERFQEIDDLMKAISSDDVIPEQFEDLYGMFKKVVKR